MLTLTDTDTVAGADQRLAPPLPRYEALNRLSEALHAYRDRDTLFHSLARELRPVVRFDYFGVALYNEDARTVEPLILEGDGTIATVPIEPLTHWVVQNQEPLVAEAIGRETRFRDAMTYFEAQGLGSVACLPLTAARRHIGMLIVGSALTHAYSEDDLQLLALASSQVALAIDDALSHDALQRALAQERDRRRDLDTSDELLRALATVLDIRQVLPRVSRIASAVLPHDLLTLTFHDRDGSVVLQAASAEWDPLPTRLKLAEDCVFDEGIEMCNDLDASECPVIEPPGFWERIQEAGYRSAMVVRMKAREQMLGLQFWSKRRQIFEERHVPVARRIADHVALAVSHEQLAETERQAAEAKVRAERLEARVKSLTDELAARSGHHRAIGQSAAWRAVLKMATQVAATDSTVLLDGESGTGKEVIARFIHRASNRAGGPFVALNCAALPDQLLESELFGYERGAFTGAQQMKIGQIEQAAGGVLFLDEVGEMSPSAQAKFLRVLQEREFQRLGGTRTLKANVRVLAATNRDLRKAMERGDFREDLYYRLQVFDIKLPPLRDRSEDILPLSEVFLQEIGQAFGRPPAGLTREAKDALLRYHWPGNVRELRNALERAAIVCEGGLITAEHLSITRREPATIVAAPATTATALPLPIETTTDLQTVERDLIARALAESSWNKSKAAAKLGLTRTQLYVRLRRYQLSPSH